MVKRRRDEYPERQALREMTNGCLKENPVKNGTECSHSVILEGSLDRELGYSKYDFRNKETDTVEMVGYNTKTLHTAMATWNWMFSMTVMESLNLKL